MTVYVIEAWTPGPAAGAWQPIAEPTANRDHAIAVMHAEAKRHPAEYRPTSWRRLRVVAR